MTYAMTALQEKSQWCWAAVAYNVDHYYSAASPWTQCRIVKEVEHRGWCCADPSGFDECNRPASLGEALDVVGRQHRAENRPLQFEEIQAEIRAGRPVCPRIEWPDGAGHYVIIAGCRTLVTGERQLWILDPLYRPSLQDYDYFCAAYRLCGVWTGTYLMC